MRFGHRGDHFFLSYVIIYSFLPVCVRHITLLRRPAAVLNGLFSMAVFGCNKALRP